MSCGVGIAVGSAIALAGLVEIAADSFAGIISAAPTAGAGAVAAGALAVGITGQITAGVVIAGKSYEECTS